MSQQNNDLRLTTGIEVDQRSIREATRAFDTVEASARDSAKDIEAIGASGRDAARGLEALGAAGRGAGDDVEQSQRRAKQAVDDTTDAIRRQNQELSERPSVSGVETFAERSGQASGITSSGIGSVSDIAAGLIEGDITALSQGLVDLADTFGQAAEAATDAGIGVGKLSGALGGGGAAAGGAVAAGIGATTLVVATAGAALAIGALAISFKLLNDAAKEAAETQASYNEGLLAFVDVQFDIEQGTASTEDLVAAQDELNERIARQSARVQALTQDYENAEASLGVFGRLFRRLFSGEEAQLVRDIEEQEALLRDAELELAGFNVQVENAGLTAEVATERIRLEAEAREEESEAREEEAKAAKELEEARKAELKAAKELETELNDTNRAIEDLLRTETERAAIARQTNTEIIRAETELATARASIVRREIDLIRGVGGSTFRRIETPEQRPLTNINARASANIIGARTR